jgi:hypothetical protein
MNRSALVPTLAALVLGAAVIVRPCLRGDRIEMLFAALHESAFGT